MPEHDPEISAAKLTLCQRLDQLRKYHASCADHFASDHKKAAKHLDFLQTIAEAIEKFCRKKKIAPAPKIEPPNLAEVLFYGSEISLPDAESRKFYYHQESTGWSVNSGRVKVKNWRAKMQLWKEGWIEREEKKPSRGGAKTSNFEKGF